jgi:hypothetical protein
MTKSGVANHRLLRCDGTPFHADIRRLLYA